MKKTIVLFLALLCLEVSAQNVITWNLGMNIASSTFGNQHPRIVVDRDGDPLVVWHQTGKMMFARWNGSGFTSPVILATQAAGASWMGPDIAAFGDTIYAVYKQMPESSDSSHIFFLTSTNGGVSFGSPVQVDSLSSGYSRFPVLSTDQGGSPLVGFMKFDASFGEAQWVMARSPLGTSFYTDVLASGWSSPTSTVCDCCPGAIAVSDSAVALLYRDNNNNVRDSWAGLSLNGGTSFTSGISIDQQNWALVACPASGPDGVIIGDTLYSVFMNGASGTSLVYFSRTSLSAAAGSAGAPITPMIMGLNQQNFPRMAHYGNALAAVWKQSISGVDQCAIRFSNDITAGFPAAWDTVDLNNVTNADVAMSDNKVYVVWEDPGSGTVKFRSGTYTPVGTGINKTRPTPISIYPNPASTLLFLTGASNVAKDQVEVYNSYGELVCMNCTMKGEGIDVSELKQGIYFLHLTRQDKIYNFKFSKN